MRILSTWVYAGLFLSLAHAQLPQEEEVVVRTNFASIDCAAAVVKSDARAVKPENILTDNKDTYWKNECANKENFVVVQLCQDILIDTVVLANYEYYSAMFKTVRLLASDVYPLATTDEWRLLGQFDANKTREEQEFKITSPQIWARYLRIEIGSHYGEELYCPLSTVKVFGTTMIEQLKIKSGRKSANDSLPAGDSGLENDADSTNSTTTNEQMIPAPDCDITCDAAIEPVPELPLAVTDDTCYTDPVPPPVCPVQDRHGDLEIGPPVCYRCARKLLKIAANNPPPPVKETVQESFFESIAKRVNAVNASLAVTEAKLTKQIEALGRLYAHLQSDGVKQLAPLRRDYSQLELLVLETRAELAWLRKCLCGALAIALLSLAALLYTQLAARKYPDHQRNYCRGSSVVSSTGSSTNNFTGSKLKSRITLPKAAQEIPPANNMRSK